MTETLVIFLISVVLAVLFYRATLKLKRQQYVNWGGAYDDKTCPGCRKAFEGNPYPIDKAPQPGSFECGDKCRHALQLTDPPKKSLTSSRGKIQ